MFHLQETAFQFFANFFIVAVFTLVPNFGSRKHQKHCNYLAKGIFT